MVAREGIAHYRTTRSHVVFNRRGAVDPGAVAGGMASAEAAAFDGGGNGAVRHSLAAATKLRWNAIVQ
jgi:hypothetical protein